MTTKIIIDDTYGYENECWYYKDFSPTLRSERFGLKVLYGYTYLNDNNENIEIGDIKENLGDR